MLTPPRIAVNISGSRLGDPHLIERLSALDIPHHAIVFELIETIFLDDPDDILLTNIEGIKKMGIDIENGFQETGNAGQHTWDLPETAVRFGVAKKTELRFTTPTART